MDTKQHFLDEDGENFKSGTTFEDIFALYYFDSKVRNSVMSALEFVESFLKQKLAYLLAEKHGELFDDYVSESVFSAGKPLKYKNERKNYIAKEMSSLINSMLLVIVNLIHFHTTKKNMITFHLGFLLKVWTLVD